MSNVLKNIFSKLYLIVGHILQFRLSQMIHDQNELYEYDSLEGVIREMEGRTTLLDSFKQTLDMKYHLDRDYLEKLGIFVSNISRKVISNPKSSLQIMHNNFINTLTTQFYHFNKYCETIKANVFSIMENILRVQHNDEKNVLARAKAFMKEEASYQEAVKKSETKLQERGIQFKASVQEYLLGKIRDFSFEDKNKLYLKVKDKSEKDLQQSKTQYEFKKKQYQAFLSSNAHKLDETMRQFLETEQQRQIHLKQCLKIYEEELQKYHKHFVEKNYRKSSTSLLNIRDKWHSQITNKHVGTFNDDCAYMKNLFKSIENHGLDKLKKFVQYQLQERNKESLKEERQVHKINLLVISVFDGDWKRQKLPKLQKLFLAHEYNRKSFIFVLQKYRQNGFIDLQPDKMNNLSQILNIFLDTCKKEHDSYNSKQLLPLVFSFSTIEDQRNIFMHEYIKHHPIWQDKEWWECAYLQTIYEETINNKKQYEDKEIVINVWDIKGTGLKLNDLESSFQEVIFHQLIYYLNSMKQFQLSKVMIQEMAQHYFELFNLPRKMFDQIQNCLRDTETTSVTSMSFISTKSNQRKSLFRFFSS